MPPYSFSSALCFLLFYLVSVNRSVVQDLVITPGSVRLLADCCRVLCWPDAGLLSQAAGRGTVLCLPECAHCHSLQHTPSILYFPVRDLHPSVIPLSSVPQTEGCDGKVEGGQRPGNKTATVAMIDRKVALHRRND